MQRASWLPLRPAMIGDLLPSLYRLPPVEIAATALRLLQERVLKRVDSIEKNYSREQQFLRCLVIMPGIGMLDCIMGNFIQM
jgi:hypothetical protein